MEKPKSDIQMLVEICVHKAGSKKNLAKYLNIEWTTVDRWAEGLFNPTVGNYKRILAVSRMAAKNLRDAIKNEERYI